MFDIRDKILIMVLRLCSSRSRASLALSRSLSAALSSASAQSSWIHASYAARGGRMGVCLVCGGDQRQRGDAGGTPLRCFAKWFSTMRTVDFFTDWARPASLWFCMFTSYRRCSRCAESISAPGQLWRTKIQSKYTTRYCQDTSSSSVRAECGGFTSLYPGVVNGQ